MQKYLKRKKEKREKERNLDAGETGMEDEGGKEAGLDGGDVDRSSDSHLGDDVAVESRLMKEPSRRAQWLLRLALVLHPTPFLLFLFFFSFFSAAVVSLFDGDRRRPPPR